MSRSAADVYKTQSIMTAPPAKLVAMCYDRTIMSLREAMRCIDSGNIQGRFDNATRAANIIAHLWSTLDMVQGGDVAKNLADIYSFAMRRLGDVNMNNDKQAATDVIALLEPLSKSWNQLANRGEGMPLPVAPVMQPARRLPPNAGGRMPARAPAPANGGARGGITISV